MVVRLGVCIKLSCLDCLEPTPWLIEDPQRGVSMNGLSGDILTAISNNSVSASCSRPRHMLSNRAAGRVMPHISITDHAVCQQPRPCNKSAGMQWQPLSSLPSIKQQLLSLRWSSCKVWGAAMRAAKVLLTIRTSPRLDCLNCRPLKLDLAGGGSTCAASCLQTAIYTCS